MNDFARLSHRRTVLTNIAALDRDQANDPDAIENALDRLLDSLDRQPWSYLRQLDELVA